MNQVEKAHPLPTTSSAKVKMEGLSDSPLGHRPRSSTVSSAGGDWDCRGRGGSLREEREMDNTSSTD